MHVIDIVVIALYFCAILGIGAYAALRVKTSEDYMVAGRNIGFPVLLGTLVGTAIGASATFGKAGKAYEVGYSIMFAAMAYMLGYFAMCWLAPKLQKARLDTVPSALEKRYGKSMRIIAACVLMLAVIALFGGQLIALGLTFEAIFQEYGIGYEHAVVIATVLIVLYTVVGGLLAVVYNDMFQTTVVLLGAGIMLPIVLFMEVGGSLDTVLVSPNQEFLGGMHWGYVLAFFPIYFSFAMIDPTIWQRIAAARSNNIVRPALIGTSLIYGVWSVIVIVLGVMAFHMLPDLSNGDSVIPTLVLTYMPPFIKGICLAGIMGIIISTADSALLITGTTVSTDIFKVLKPNLTDRQILAINRGTIIVVAMFGLVFALQKSSIFDVLMLSLAIFVAGLFVPVMAALFYKKATKSAAVSSAIVGASVEIMVFLAKSQGYLPEWAEPILFALTLSALTMWVVSRLTYNEQTKTEPLLVGS